MTCELLTQPLGERMVRNMQREVIPTQGAKAVGMDGNDSFQAFCGGIFFDENLLLNNSWPEFTPCFQESVLVWVPCAWLWVTLPFYLGYLCHQDGIPVPINLLNTLKTFFSVFLFFLAVIDLIKAASDNEDGGKKKVYDVVYVSGGIKAATFLLSTMLIQYERKKGLVTSGVLWLFFLFLFITNIVPFYSKIQLQEYNDYLFRFAIFYIYFALICLELILHSFAEKMTRAGYYEMGKRPSPEQEASFLSRITYCWINKLVFTGYRKDLEESDLFELHPRDKSERIVPKFQHAWDKEMNKAKRINERKRKEESVVRYRHHANTMHQVDIQASTEKTPLLNGPSKNTEVGFKGTKDEKDGVKLKEASLFKVLAKTYGRDILRSWFCKFVYDLLQFVSPMLLNILIGYTQNRDNEPEWKGYVFACSFFVVALVQSLLFHQNFHIGMTLGMRVKSSCISAVYKKALTINNEAKKTSTVGEIVNLMSVDCQRLQDVTGYLWMLWSAPLQISLALYLLYNTMGVSVFAGLVVMVLLMPVNAFIATKQRNFQVQQMKCKDNRIKLMNEVLNGMKVLKLYAWELSFQEKVLDIRNKELGILLKGAYLQAGGTFCWTCAPFLVTLATFATYVLASDSHYLDAQKAFVALSLFNILRFPINLLPMMVSYVVQAQVSVGRIGKFLRHTDLDPSNVKKDPHSDHAMSIKDGTFTWDKSSPTTTLKKINLNIPEGKLIAVVGQVGMGKSSLISAFLGEMEKLSGFVTVKSSIAYVPQQAWIQNATLQNNILFGKPIEEQRYKKIIDACALQPDLDILQGGDQTEIGEKGINLSGGQKQRVSLARSVYSDREIYLFDDPLSAVDSHVGKHIFQEVVGSKGLLKHKTRVLVTHGVHWLPMVDEIVVLVDGQISEHGSYEELLSHDGAFAQFLKTYLTQENQDDDDPEIQAIKSKILERVDSVTSDGATSGDEQRRASPGKLIRRMSRTTSESKDTEKSAAVEKKLEKEKEKDKLIQEEKAETGKVKASVFIDYARAVGLLTSIIIFISYGCYQFVNVYSNVWLSQWTDDPLLKNQSLANTSDYQSKNSMYLGVYGGLGIGQAIIVLSYSLLASTRMVRAAGNLHAKMLSNIMRSPMSFFDTTPIGRIVNRFSRDVETVDNNLPALFRMWINNLFSVLSTIIVISYSTPIFLVVIIPLGVFYWLVQRFYVPTSRQLKRIESTTRSPIYTHFSETITGATSIRAYDATDRFYTESQQRVDKNLVFYFAGIASNRWLGFRLEFLGNCLVLAAAMFAVVSEDLPGGLVGLSVSYALQVTGSLNWMVRMTSDLETNIVSVERLKEYSETPTEAPWINDHRRPPPGWPQKGTLNFVNYMTRYRPGLDLVLKGISCEINGSEKVGIVGRTGAGKSSMTVALFRLIEAASGSIVVDGITAGDIGLHDLRSKLTILPQDPVLFSGSLRMNLDPFDQYNDDAIWVALEHAHLKKFVQELPVQLEYECGEGGQNLSVGQRQLVCLARTLLRKTKILILDEATAAVDMETDDLIQETIRSEFKDCTVLTIAHRLNTIMDYDRIIVLDQGLIKEYDSPDRLMKDKNSIFYGMAKDAGLAS